MKSIVTTAVAVVCAAVLAACNGSGDDRQATPTKPDTAQVCGTESGEGCAPSSERVDLSQPSFSDPTDITNPLFPISELQSVLLLGNVEGDRRKPERGDRRRGAPARYPRRTALTLGWPRKESHSRSGALQDGWTC